MIYDSNIYSKMHSILCANTHDTVITFKVDRMVQNIKNVKNGTWLFPEIKKKYSMKRETTFSEVIVFLKEVTFNIQWICFNRSLKTHIWDKVFKSRLNFMEDSL